MPLLLLPNVFVIDDAYDNDGDYNHDESDSEHSSAHHDGQTLVWLLFHASRYVISPLQTSY